MSEFRRYAVYYLTEDAALASFGASWLGWDIARGQSAIQPPVDGIEDATATPRKYGFHGTLKPPFTLAEDGSVADLRNDVAALASRTAPLRLDGLRVARMGAFLALEVEGETAALDALAFDCVSTLDRYRAPALPTELARRRSASLTERQDALLVQWGYPFVADEFRFHLTLTGRLDPDARHAMRAALEKLVPPLPRPFIMGEISLVGEGVDGMFRLLERFSLGI